MPFRQRAIMACGILILVPTAIWAIRGENPFLLGAGNDGPTGPAMIYGPYSSGDGADHGGAGHHGALHGYFEAGDHTGHGRAHAHPHGDQVCASGCAASNHPTEPLTKKEFQRLIAAYAAGPTPREIQGATALLLRARDTLADLNIPPASVVAALDPLDEALRQESKALESLLYYGRQTRLYLDREGPGPLDEDRADFLRRELKRGHVLVHFRVVDEHGVIRVSVPPTRVPLDIRHEFKMDTQKLQPLQTSGTVKRVGLYHLWQRI